MTVKQTIAHLDELRKEEYGTTIHLLSEKPRREKLEFLSELAEHYDSLRKAALAGAALAEAVEKMKLDCGKKRSEWRQERDAALETYKQSV